MDDNLVLLTKCEATLNFFDNFHYIYARLIDVILIRYWNWNSNGADENKTE